jgi:tRNA/rRNA methyltransferase
LDSARGSGGSAVRALYNRFLPVHDQRDRLKVVLVSPRNPLNIGAAARAMANFGFSHLAVVTPYAPHWREARSAVGAPEVLKNAVSLECLADATSDCTLVVGTGTLTYRKPEQRVVRLPELAPLIRQELDSGGRVGLLFGPEKHGLTCDDLSYCHALVEIPTDARQPSMNLGQAVAVCLYELAVRSFDFAAPGLSRPRAGEREPAAASKNLDILAGLVEQVMEAAHYSPATMRNANRHDMRLLLRRLAPNEKDAQRMLGLFRRILWRLKR